MRIPNHTNQAGLALIIGLLMLIVFAILGVTAMNTTNLQERMASNSRNTLVAFNNSENQLRLTELYLSSSDCEPLPSPQSFGSTSPPAGLTNIYDASNTADAATVNTYLTDRGWLATASPQDRSSIIEVFPNPSTSISDGTRFGGFVTEGLVDAHQGAGGSGDVTYHRYRISSRATGGTGNEFAITQSTYIIDCA